MTIPLPKEYMKRPEKKEILKSCPFCGGEAKVQRFVDYDLVRCLNCKASSVHTNEQQAISAWNKRVNEDNGSFLKRKRVPHISTSC